MICTDCMASGSRLSCVPNFWQMVVMFLSLSFGFSRLLRETSLRVYSVLSVSIAMIFAMGFWVFASVALKVKQMPVLRPRTGSGLVAWYCFGAVRVPGVSSSVMFW